MRRPSTIFILSLCLPSACFSDFNAISDIDPLDSSGKGNGDSSGNGDGDGDGDGVPCNGICIAAPEGRWSAVFAMRDTGDGCGSDFVTEIDTYYSDLSPDAATCSCSCSGSPTGGTCPQTLPFYNDDDGCPNGPGVGGNVLVGACFGNSSYYYATLAGTPTGTSCSSGTLSENIPMPSWGSETLACSGGELPGTCSIPDDRCILAPDAPYEPGRLCVSQIGDHTCPLNFGEKSLRHTGYADDRACPGSCSCVEADAPVCVATYVGYQGTHCSNAAGTTTFDTDDGYFCILQSPTSTTDSVRVTSNTPSGGSCVASGSIDPAGAATETGQTTVCCNN